MNSHHPHKEAAAAAAPLGGGGGDLAAATRARGATSRAFQVSNRVRGAVRKSKI